MPEATTPLVALRARGAVLVLIAVAAVVFIAMAVWLHGGSDPVGVDRTVDTWLQQHTGSTVSRVLLALSEPALTISAAGIVAVGAAVLRRWEVVVLAATAPALTVLLGSVVLKPVIGRRFGIAADLYGISPGYAFPSGHEGMLTATVVVAVVTLLRSGCDARVKAAGVVVGIVWIVLGALGLVRNRYHYATDTVGSWLLALVVVLGTALTIDALRRLSSPGGRDPSRTPPAA